ncbi:MAG: FkbM family methyltransferase [Candidatus Babeliales bacterium]
MKKINKPQQFSRAYLTTLLPANAIFIEAGAHDGTDTVKFSALFSSGTIHAFEPVPVLYAELCARTHNLPNVRTYQLALSNTIGTAPMFVTEGVFSSTNSLFAPQEIQQEHPDVHYQTIKVPTTTLHAWAHQNTIPTIDCMWLDAQGAELAILQGAEQLLSNVSALVVEVNTTERYKGIPQYTEIRDWLAQHNFAPLIEHLHHTTWGNVLFYNTQLFTL